MCRSTTSATPRTLGSSSISASTVPSSVPIAVFTQPGWIDSIVEGPLIADRREVCVQAAMDGAGIAFAVESVVRDRIEDGVLVPLLEDWSAPFPGFFLCHPRQKLTPPALRAFLNAVTGTA